MVWLNNSEVCDFDTKCRNSGHNSGAPPVMSTVWTAGDCSSTSKHLTKILTSIDQYKGSRLMLSIPESHTPLSEKLKQLTWFNS